jgi:prepilin-type N-terminal cleavage/methylation domain-containing protein
MLQRSMEKRRAGEVGFTLVELLVVIAILGILAAIVVFAVGGIGDKGQQSANETSCSTLHTAEEAYFVKNGSYAVDPGAQTALKAGGYLHTTNPAFSIASDPTAGYKITGPNCTE